MLCRFVETSRKGTWICEECKVITPFGRDYITAPIRECPGILIGPRQPRLSKKVSYDQPGTELKLIFENLNKWIFAPINKFLFKYHLPLLQVGILITQSCSGCGGTETMMNDFGWRGCRKNKRLIRSKILERLKNVKYRMWFVPKLLRYRISSIALRLLIRYAIYKAKKREKRGEKMLSAERVSLIKEVESHLNGRTLEEALGYLDRCDRCSNFRETHCLIHSLLPKKLAVGHCKYWNDIKTENSIAFRFFTTSDLVEDSKKLVPKLPLNIDLIVGASRSGLIPATSLAAQLHLPMYSVGKGGVFPLSSGWRLKETDAKPKSILLVEDTVYSGNTMRTDKKKVAEVFPDAQIMTAAIYAHPKAIDILDFYVLSVPGRHYLEWNFFNSIAISRCIYDFDGILCEDIPARDDDDGERYLRALQNAVPKYLVRREPIPIIVTARLEKYRTVTEAWMEHYGVKCKKLVMGPWESNRQRAQKGAISKFKADVYKSYNYTLFVESDPAQAREIVMLTGKEVLCPILKRVLHS